MRSGFWRKCRVIFRWCRIGAWLAVLAAVGAVVWLNQAGLPDFLKTRLVAKLHERGVELQFSRMRLRLAGGIVAENVRIGVTNAVGRPSLALAEVQLQFNYRALLRREWQVDGLVMREGRLTWPVSPTNSLQLDNLQAGLRFQTNETWALDNFQANFAGAKLMLSGEIAHAPEIRNWEMFRVGGGSTKTDWPSRLQQFSDTVDGIHLEGAPLLDVTIHGDARDIHTFVVRLKATAAGAQTPWFQARDLQLTANLTSPADASLGRGKPAGAPKNFDPAWEFWTNTQPYQLEWSARLAQLKSKKLNAKSIAADGFWSAPEFAVTNLSVELGGGKLEAAVVVNVATRQLAFTNSAGFDLRALDAFWPGQTNPLAGKVSLPLPPSWQVVGGLSLPAWTNSRPDWNGEVRRTVRLQGGLAVTNATVFGAQIDLVRAHFSYSNLVWQLPALAITQAKTHLKISGSEDDATQNFRAHISGVLDPEVARPFLTTSNARRGFELVQLAEPLALDVEIGGRGQDYERIAVAGRVALTNFTVRGEQFGDVTATLNYTNRVLEFLQPLTHTGAQMMMADSITLDFNRRLILFTNGFSTADPMPVVRAIGPKTAQAVEAYHFLTPPTARINGRIPLGEMKNGTQEMATTDMRFDILGGAPFQWRRLRTPDIAGTVYWRGQTLLVSNVTAPFYGGAGEGFAYFDFRVPHEGADFNFAVDVTNVNVHLLAADLSAKTNRLEGILAGRLVVTDGSTATLQSWNGYGQARLQDGLLWDIPIISFLSPVLNAVAPGLGNSRATEAAGKFGITNGVGFTDSLEIRSTLTRLDYSGTIDFESKVNAHVTARLLRDTPVVGPLFSTVLWPVSKLFEYRVTGPLDNPKSEPLYVLPKILLMPLHPIHTLESIIPGADSFIRQTPGK